MPGYSDVLSTVAIAVSLGSLSISAFGVFRDRPRLKITSQFFEESEYGPAGINIVVVNKGRRPVILHTIGGIDKEGGWSATFFDHEKGGLRLSEHERYERSLRKEDTTMIDPERPGPDLPYERMWIEDSLGNRHPIPRSREYLLKLWS